MGGSPLSTVIVEPRATTSLHIWNQMSASHAIDDMFSLRQIQEQAPPESNMPFHSCETHASCTEALHSLLPLHDTRCIGLAGFPLAIAQLAKAGS